ncbi:MAG: hypothetical protein KF851_03175 [Pirellulaceae bacterium]|nr:hypothetical protein [Pirellulaceae bacterium]
MSNNHSNNSSNRNSSSQNSSSRIGSQAFGRATAPARKEVSKATSKAASKNSSKASKAKQQTGKGDESKTFSLVGSGLPNAARPWIDPNRIESESQGVIDWIFQVEHFIITGIEQLAELATRIDQASEMAAKFTIGTRDEQDTEAMEEAEAEAAAEAAAEAERAAKAKPSRKASGQGKDQPSDIGDGEQGSFGDQDFSNQNQNGVASNELGTDRSGSGSSLQIGSGQLE